MASPNDRVVRRAESYLGVEESPLGSNRGPEIDRWSARWGMRGVPWCGIFADAMFSEAQVDDDGIPHPSVHQMVLKSKQLGRLWDGRSPIPKGSLWMQDWIHTGIVSSDHPANSLYVDIIDGNSSNAVRRTRRIAKGGAYHIAIPSAIAAGKPEPQTVRKIEYYLRDNAAKPQVLRVKGVVARWTKPNKTAADKTVENLLNGSESAYWAQLRPRVVWAGSINRWVIQIGHIKLRGPWKESTKADIEAVQKRLEQQLGRKLELIERPYLVKVG